MRKRCTRTLSLLSMFVFIGSSFSMAAQIPVTRGRLNSPAGESTQGLIVILEGISTHAESSRAEVRGDGSFEFRDVPAKDYALRVPRGFGLTVCQQFVTIHEHMPKLEVRLPERESNGAGEGAATVSAKQLMYPPRKKAVQAFQRALRLSEAGKFSDAASELQKAIRISPEFAEALTDLAVQFFRLGRLEESMAESARAIQIGGPDPRNLCNLASAQARLNRLAEAEKLARAALLLDSGYVKASLILGSTLVDQPVTRREGITTGKGRGRICLRPAIHRAAPGIAVRRTEATMAAPFSSAATLIASSRRTSARDIGTCRCRSDELGWRIQNRETTGVFSIAPKVAANGQPNANSCSTSGCKSVSTFISRSQ